MSNIQKALAAYSKGDITTTKNILTAELRLNKNNVDANHLMGVLYFSQDDLKRSVSFFKRAHKKAPKNHDILCNYAGALRALGENTKAEGLYRQAERLQPTFYKAVAGLGLCAQDRGEARVACEYFKKAVRFAPDKSGPHYNLANCYVLLGEYVKAEQCFLHALEWGADKLILNNMGNLLVRLGRYEEALVYYAKGLGLAPDDSTCCLNTAQCCAHLLHFKNAYALSSRAYENDPGNTDVLQGLSSLSALLGKHEQSLFLLHEIIKIKATSKKAAAQALYLSHCFEGKNHTDLTQVATRIFKGSTKVPALLQSKTDEAELTRCERSEQSCSMKPMPFGDKIKIGFFSPDFRIHSVAYFFFALLDNLNREEFEIFCFSETKRFDDTTKSIASKSDGFIETQDLSDTLLVKKARELSLTIAVDLAGHTEGNRQGAFAKRVAPLQLTYLGFPGTTANPEMDYRLVDDITDPDDSAGYSEKILRLPSPFICYTPATNAPEIHSREGKELVLGCFNNSLKLGDQCIDLFCEALRVLPDARLLLKSKAFTDIWVAEEFKSRFVARGIDEERLQLRGWGESIHDGLAIYNEIDIALDSYPYNGTTTTCEALYMGTPVLTLSGTTHASRVGSSILNSLNKGEWVAHDLLGFKTALKKMGENRAVIRKEGNNLRREFCEGRICDGKMFARSFAEVLTSLL